MAAKKSVRAEEKRAEVKSNGKIPARRKPVVAVQRENAPAVAPSSVKRPVGPTARTCPLVMDGELAEEDFSSRDCLTCGEFDCRFCEAGEGSGDLRSRLFASSEDADGDAGLDDDLDFGGDETTEDEEEGDEGEDAFT